MLITEALRPRRPEELVGNAEARKRIEEWLRRWAGGRVPDKRCLLIVGPPGVGKTTAALVYLNHFGYSVIELNASDERSKKALEPFVIAARRGAALGGRIALLLDEIDGLAPRESPRTVATLCRETSVPVVMTANDPWSPRLREIRRVAEIVEFRPLSRDEILFVLRRARERLGLDVPDEVLRDIAERSSGDLRFAINALLAAVLGLEVGQRKRGLRAPEAAELLLRCNDLRECREVLDRLEEDIEDLVPWLVEALRRSAPSNIFRFQAAAMLSEGLRLLAKARREGLWSLLPFALDMIALAGFGAGKTRPIVAKPRILDVRRSVPREALERLARAAACSKRKAGELLPTILAAIARSPATSAAELAQELGLDPAQIARIAPNTARSAAPTEQEERRGEASAEARSVLEALRRRHGMKGGVEGATRGRGGGARGSRRSVGEEARRRSRRS